MNQIVRFQNWNCKVIKSNYMGNNAIALLLVDAVDGSDIATATVMIHDDDTSEREVIIKNYSENRGMYEALLAANVITIAHRYIDAGYTQCPVSFLKQQ